MPDKSYKPDLAYMSKLVQSIASDFGERDRQDARRENMYWQTNPIPHPAHVDFQPVHMGVVPESVQRIRGVLDESPRAKVIKTAIDQMTLRREESIEEAANAVFPALQDDSDYDTWDYIIEDVIRYGRGYDELLYVPQYHSESNPDFPKRKGGESASDYNRRKLKFNLESKLPLVWRHLPARNVYLWYDDAGVCEAIVAEERRVADILKAYDDVPNLQSEVDDDPLRVLDKVYFLRYYNRDWCLHWATDIPAGAGSLIDAVSNAMHKFDGDVVHEEENPYKRVPIIETRGITSSDRGPARSQMSIFDHMMNICDYLDQLVSQKATAVRQWAWATPFIKNTANKAAGFEQNIPWSPDSRPEPVEIISGMLHYLLPGEDVGWFIAPGDGAGSNDLLKVIQTQADLLGVSSSVFSGEALTANGYLYNSIMNAIRSKYSPITRHVKRSHRQRVQLLFKCVELHGEPIYIYREGDAERKSAWLQLDPDDLKDVHYNIEVDYEDHLPTDDAADAQLALLTTQGDNPLLDINTARERYLRDRAPEKTAQRVLIQKFMQLPPVQEFLMGRAVKRAQLELDYEDKAGPASIPPEVMAQLPPGLLAALGLLGPTAAANAQAGAPLLQDPGMAMGSGPPVQTVQNGPNLAPIQAPVPAGGVAAPRMPVLGPGQPTAGNRRIQRSVPRQGGRAAGQSRAPQQRPRAYSP
jgi:hypothetical protein